jgi:ABC-type sugar transport system ATPase subunit
LLKQLGSVSYSVELSPLCNEVKNPLLVVENISTVFSQNISFEINKGESVGILSDNYIASSELIKVIYGLKRKFKGTIKMNGTELKSSPFDSVKFKIGFIPEDRRTEGIFANMNVLDNIALMQFKATSTAGVLNTSTVEGNVSIKTSQLGIKYKSIYQSASELSGGNQQKVLLARWMSYNFDLLILSEPMSGIDIASQQEIKSVLSELKKNGKSFLIVASDANDVKGLCDRMIYLPNRDKGLKVEKDKI